MGLMSVVRGAEDQRDAVGVETMETLNNLLDLESQTAPLLCKKSCLKKVVAVGVCAGNVITEVASNTIKKATSN